MAGQCQVASEVTVVQSASRSARVQFAPVGGRMGSGGAELP